MPVSGERLRMKLKNEAQVQHIPPQVLYVQYVTEALLRRAQASPHIGRLILKGSATGPARYGSWPRPARCVDFHCVARLDYAQLRELVMAVASVRSVDDGVTFDACFTRYQRPRPREVTGFFIQLRARLGSAQVPLRIYVDFGHQAPRQVRYLPFPSLCAGIPVARVLCTSPAVAVAEKLCPMIEFGGSNTRFKDYFDLWRLAEAFEFEATELIEAVEDVFETRGAGKLLRSGSAEWREGLSRDYAISNGVSWSAWCRRSGLIELPPLLVVVQRLQAFVIPLLAWVVSGQIPDQIWTPRTGWHGGPETEPKMRRAA